MTLVFRFYGNSNLVDVTKGVIERDCSPEEKDSIVHELQADGWELEAIL